MKNQISTYFVGFTFAFLFVMASSYSLAQQYFQQEVKYSIHVRLDDKNHTLSGEEKIIYINHSQDTLHFLYFHIWPNAYKNNETALAKQLLENKSTFMYYAPDSLQGFIDSLNFTSEKVSLPWKYDSLNIDICKIFLKNALIPDDSVTISTPFFVKIPDARISRLGHDGQSYQITQWFPKPAVYDANGWNEMPYLDQGEFYSEFGSFDVYITLPANYVVGATGDLVDNPAEEQWLNQKSVETSQIKTYNKNDKSFPASSNELKTLHYFQKNVHDFAWFADKRYHVLKSNVVLPYSGRNVTTWVMFTNRHAEQWKNANEYVNDAIFYYSKWIGEYPYNQATAAEGALSAGGGMEYPNITVISASGDSLALETVVMHEVGHNWFYGMLGSNERKNPWLDEGINSFYEYRYLQTKYLGSTMYLGKLKKVLKLPEHIERVERELLYLITARTKSDQAATLSAPLYSTINYGGIVYEKSAVSFYSLMEYLGESTFDSIMKIYFETWKFKHPQPGDLKNIFKKCTTKNTDWFFNGLLGSTGKIDYSVNGISRIKSETEDSFNISIKNKGSIQAPFELCVYENKNKISSQWYDGFNGKKKIKLSTGSFDVVRINPDNNMPEISRKNNTYQRKLFPKTEPIRFQPIINLEDPEHTQVFYSPAIAYNKYNGFMAGAAFYNGFIPAKKVQYYIIPMYGVADKKLTGIAHADYSIYLRNFLLQKITVNTGISTFSYSESPMQLSFFRNYFGADVSFRPVNSRSSVSTTASITHYIINKQIAAYVKTGTENIPVRETKNYTVNQFKFKIEDQRVINPYSAEFTAEQNKDFMKCFVVLNQKINYSKPRKSLDIRLFAGSFIYSEANSLYDYRFRLSGTPGTKDYLFSSYFIGRSEGSGLLSQQFAENDGAFKSPTILGQTSDWMLALNLKSSLPGILPLKIFVDMGTVKGYKNNGENAIFYMDAGVQLSIIKNIFDIYIPLLYSSEIKSNFDLNNITFAEKIRFTLNIEKLNPFSLVKSIK